MNHQTRDQAARQARRDRAPRPATWPFAEDRTALDRARRIAHAFRAAAESPDPKAAAAQVLEHARLYREHWVDATPDRVAGTRRLTAEEAGEVVGVRPKTIYSWSSRGLAGGRHKLTRYADGFDERELLDFDAARRTHPTEDAS